MAKKAIIFTAGQPMQIITDENSTTFSKFSQQAVRIVNKKTGQVLYALIFGPENTKKTVFLFDRNEAFKLIENLRTELDKKGQF